MDAAAVFAGFRPQRVVLAGEVDGIYTADPLVDDRAELIPELASVDSERGGGGTDRSHGVDVTGGMKAKVRQSIRMVESNPGLDVVVCSGLTPGNVEAVLRDPACVRGTRVVA